MKENKITVVINKPAEMVFEFTTDPKNTHLWIPSIEKEVAEKYPPEIGTKYKNCGKDSKWNFYKVFEYKQNKIFGLTDLNENYHVKYSYRKLSDNKTEMAYFEWVKSGELKNPFTKDILQNLKSVLENQS